MSDVFLCAFKRTPIGRYGGGLAMVRPDDLAATVIDGLLDQQDIAVDEVIFGCANQAGEDNRNVARMATLLSRLGEGTPALTVNRLCASGLDAIITATRTIRDGGAEIIIAGGVESMSRAPFVMPKPETAFSRTSEIHDTTIGWRFIHHRISALYGVDSMPETAENVAADFHISRADQDAFALRSQTRYSAAWHATDILPVGSMTTDEHPRATTLEKLSALKTPFRTPGTVTAGNASGINDGAAGVLLASAAAVKRHRLTPLARIGQAASAAVAPRIMGIGPVAALAKLTERTGLTPQDFDVIELNEAFAAQVLACLRQWQIPDEAAHVNAYGGGICIGHPLGASGARIAGTAARRLAESGGKHALATLCVGVGQGVALSLHAV